MVDFFYEFPDKTNLKKVRDGLNKNSEQLEQSFNYIPVEWFGVSVDNSTTENDKAMIDAITSMHENKHGLQFGIGDYSFGTEWKQTSYDNFFAIRGVDGLSRGDAGSTRILRTANVPLFTIDGGGILTTGVRHLGALVSDMYIYGSDQTEDLIRLYGCADFRFNNVKITSTLGRALHMWECTDSRFNNCSIENTGSLDGSLQTITFRSGTYNSVTRELTNQIHFIGCRFEGYNGTVLGTEGDNVNEMFFAHCKFESEADDVPHISFTNANMIIFSDCEVTQKSASATLESLVEFNNCDMIKWDGFLEIVSTSAVESLIKIDDCYGVKINVITDQTGNKITGDYLIKRVGGASGLYEITSQFSQGVTKLPFNGNGIVNNENLASKKYYSSGDTKLEIKKTGTTKESSWYWQVLAQGDSSRILFRRDLDGVTESMEYTNEDGTKFINNNLVIDNGGLSFPQMDSDPVFSRVGTRYYDDTRDADRIRYGTSWIRIGMSNGAPTSGTWAIGDRVYDPSPTAGGYVGWICTVSGTAGVDAVFKGFGLIEV